MEKDIKQILELVQTINNKCDNLEKENFRLQNQYQQISKKLDNLKRDIANVPQTESNIRDNQILRVKDILNEYPVTKSVLYRYLQNHQDNGLKVIQKDEGGVYSVKRVDWEDWFNNMLATFGDFTSSDIEILEILNQDEDIDIDTQISKIKEVIEKKSKSPKPTLTEKEFDFNL